ncbi:hypothetical protein BJF79_15640 [Actinomadura sp. CNU-125]|nr:hypothetical protein BJF79_15640 [Actinomadura sp. CNU-125]
MGEHGVDAALPWARSGAATVVSPGETIRAGKMSSKPITLTSSGTRTPAAWRASIRPIASWSL